MQDTDAEGPDVPLDRFGHKLERLAEAERRMTARMTKRACELRDGFFFHVLVLSCCEVRMPRTPTKMSRGTVSAQLSQTKKCHPSPWQNSSNEATKLSCSCRRFSYLQAEYEPALKYTQQS